MRPEQPTCRHEPGWGSTVRTSFTAPVPLFGGRSLYFAECSACQNKTDLSLTVEEAKARAAAGWWHDSKELK